MAQIGNKLNEQYIKEQQILKNQLETFFYQEKHTKNTHLRSIQVPVNAIKSKITERDDHVIGSVPRTKDVISHC